MITIVGRQYVTKLIVKKVRKKVKCRKSIYVDKKKRRKDILKAKSSACPKKTKKLGHSVYIQDSTF